MPTSPRTGIQLDALARGNRAASACKRAGSCPASRNRNRQPDARGGQAGALVALLARHGIPLIEDDVYGELYFDRARPLPAKAYDRNGLVLHCASFSKCLAPGYRVGWVAAGRYAREVEQQKLMTTLASPSPNQLALAEYLDHGGYDRHLRQLRATLGRQQQQMMAALARYFSRRHARLASAGRVLPVGAAAAGSGRAGGLPCRAGTAHQRRAGADFFAARGIPRLPEAELWPPVGRHAGRCHAGAG